MVKRYCDMCGKEISSLGFLTVAIEGYGITTALNGQMQEKEICEECAVKVREFILVQRGGET